MDKIKINFEDMPDLNDYFKENIGLGVGSIYKLPDKYVMVFGSKCQCCNPTGQIIWEITSSGAVVKVLEEFNDHHSVETIISFNIPEHLSKNYLKISY